MKRLAAICILVVLGSVISPAAMGAPLTDDIYINTWMTGTYGQAEGPFEIKIYTDNTTGVGYGSTYSANTTPLYDALAFCVETKQYFTPGGISPGYNTFNINNTGNNSVETNRLLSGYSAFVFTRFEHNFPVNQVNQTAPVTGFTGSAPTGFSWAQVMNDYQNAIWAGMVDALTQADVGSAQHSEYGVYTGHALDLSGTIGSNYSDFTELGISWADYVAATGGNLTHTVNVAILQIKGVTPGDGYIHGQDQCFLSNAVSLTGVNPVPEPASLAIWAIAGGLGAAGLSFKRRRQGRWSDENRQAIMGIVQGRSHG